MEKHSKAIVDYDSENDSLYISPVEKRYERSVIKNDLIVDLDKDGNIVGFEILDISKKVKLPKVYIKDLKNIEVSAEKVEEGMKFEIKLIFKVRNDKKIKNVNFVDVESDLKATNMSFDVASAA